MSGNYTVIPTDYDALIPPAKVNTPLEPTDGNAHQWVCQVLFSVSQAKVDECAAAWMAGLQPDMLSLDHENLMNVQGPACMKCAIPLTPSTYQTPCRVHVVTVYGQMH